MAKGTRVDPKLIAGGVAAAAAIGAAAFIGAKVYKQLKDANFDEMFDDLNESFFSTWPKEEEDV